MKDEFYAHSLNGKPPEEWHRLEDHLIKVAKMAGTFANDFRAGGRGYVAGMWHDLGKYSQEFQERLFTVSDPDAHSEGRLGCP